ncbi:cytosolic protein [Litchfieldia alkalitelluris]|uniref:cytosolic protein n=1 Tax=Litchfieldia alkalitelluris TaxID=304268 RepID=UPI000996239F|nr:cytosolic protein [Litchfieldia alkalitelluris]
MGKFKSFFTNHNETRDEHQDPALRSHYYKTTQKKALEAVQELFGSMNGYKVTSVSEERGELSIKSKKAFIVVTIISVRPFETSVDFSVTTESGFIPIDFGYSKKEINNLYNKLDSKLPFLRGGQ